ncbi:MAG: carboxymuconolactone decarboxylase family protein [Paracoccaceae bacterium]|nr:carboxymuconolactone decarboxylase family protein [Paracoccaceae bacterium]
MSERSVEVPNRKRVNGAGSATPSKAGVEPAERSWPDALIDQLAEKLDALSIADAAIARLAAAATAEGRPGLVEAVEHGRALGLSDDVLGEICLQCTIYAGPSRTAAIREAVAHLVDVPETLARPAGPRATNMRSDLHGARDGEAYSDRGDAIMAPLYGTIADLGYDGIWARPGPSRRQRLICAVAALAVAGSPATLLKFCHAARSEGLTGAELRDVISWTVLAQGGPRTFDALISARSVMEER